MKTLLLMMLVVGCGLGWLTREATRRRQVVADLEKMGAKITWSQKTTRTPELLDTGFLGRIISLDLSETQIVIDAEGKDRGDYQFNLIAWPPPPTPIE